MRACPHPLQNEVFGDSFVFPWLQLKEANRSKSSLACSFLYQPLAQGSTELLKSAKAASDTPCFAV